jgi:guanylate kinase
MSASSKKLVIIAAPSGAGKTSVVRHLLKVMPDRLSFSISAATRPPRMHERDGVDYYFMSPAEFEKKIANDEFVEWEMVYEGKYYGTLKSELERIWAEGRAPLLDVDVVGGVDLQELYPKNSLSLFILPPSLDELHRRLEARGTETPETLAARIFKAEHELGYQDQFDHVIVNDRLERACAEAEEKVREFLEHG